MREESSVGEVSEITGLSADALRYYEREGLIDPVERSDAGRRRYSAEDVEWIQFLLRLRATGMPIRLMRQYAELRREGDHTAKERRMLLKEHRREVKRRLEQLSDHLHAVERKIHIYEEMEEKDGITEKT